MSDRYYSAEVTEAIARERDALRAQRDRLQTLIRDFIECFDADYCWIENGDNADYAMERLRAAIAEGGQDEE